MNGMQADSVFKTSGNANNISRAIEIKAKMTDMTRPSNVAA
jgi:hypothetical protein